MNKILIFIILLLVILFVYKKKSFFSNINYYDYFTNLYYNFKPKFETYFNNQPLESVDMIYCIAMPQRKNYIINKMYELNVNFTLLNAITPIDLTDLDYNISSATLTDKSLEMYNKKTRLALQVSFTMCMIDAIKNHYNTIIIFEDDIIINVDKQTLNNAITEFKNSDFVLFYMGYCLLDCNQNFNTNQYKYLVNVPNKTISCTHAIVYKVKYLKDIINTIYYMNDNYDNQLRKYFKNKNVNICITKQTYFDQNTNELGSLNQAINDNNFLTSCKLK